MKDLLDMSFRVLIKTAPQANSERCRVLRQQCALEFLGLVKMNKRLISIDETWLDSGDYRRRAWKPRGLNNSIPVRKVEPRITLVVALDNHGRIYASLLQANSNQETMALFMRQLVQTLDCEDKNWRQNTVLVWDGAGYHTCQHMKTFLREQQVPMMTLGPYSYLMAPAELLFAALKMKKLNLDDVPLGKK